MELIEIIDSLNNKWSVITKGNFGTSYYAQSVHATNGNSDEFPFIMNVVSKIHYLIRFNLENLSFL